MLRHWAIAILPLILLGGCAQRARVRDLASLHDTPLYEFNEREVDAYLQWLSTQPLTPGERVVHLARKNIGQPYRLFLLGEHPFELHDPDPLYCLSASDCVTFVEHMHAMALSHDWASFFRTLQRIRYKNGVIGILTRNHFTEADWNVNNAWLFEDVTVPLAGSRARPMRVRTDRAKFFSQFGLGEDLPVEEIETAYIPKAYLAEVSARLRDGDVVEIVRDGKLGAYVGHMGLLARDASGDVTILHATRPRVREESLASYLSRHEDVVGIKVLRMAGSRAQRKDDRTKSPRPWPGDGCWCENPFLHPRLRGNPFPQTVAGWESCHRWAERGFSAQRRVQIEHKGRTRCS